MHSNELIECVRQAVIKYSDNLRRLAFTYVKSVHSAEDIVQDVFLTYLQKAPDFDSAEHEKAWLLRVTINKSRNVIKTGWYRSRLKLTEERGYLLPEQSEVLEAVLSLAEKYRLPIHLYYYEGYSIEEIAKLLDTNPATVGTRLARARGLLRQSLGGFEDEA
ncbi:MAG TPA: sigma-70 family RNA polymerase sigma factor [Oscillospiraceae bacterium]|nr:sigma-70 family RNA polymerase sigma factor [Oscillospiraceae bacterium]HPK36353.1 sigma-70 family RNA polymerase sigma factor [Oscillospiraceae bacterium]HPR76704.1 sigma-70 family RNA polymerase sigma factor [Oscillospiraceae bacterium]